MLLFVAAGCTRSLPQTARNQIAEPSATGTNVGAYESIVNIYGDPADRLNIPGKYGCGGYSLTIPDFAVAQTRDLFLQPTGRLLLHVVGRYALQYDVTFSKDCTHAYYADSLGAEGSTLHVVDVASGRAATVTIPGSVFPPAVIMEMDHEYYPALDFVYAIDNGQLLLSFSNPTTGRDPATNQTSQAVLNLSDNNLTLLSAGGGPAPVLLNYQTNTLIMPEQTTPTGAPTDRRAEVNLNTGEQKIVRLSTPYRYAAPCDRNAYDKTTDFQKCRDKSLQNLLK